MTKSKADAPAKGEKRPQKPLTPEAERALAEAAERRKRRDAANAERPAEKGGRKGPEPIRYGDWEKDGIISDF
ncbi:MAG: DUF1674 domain-containing protein [Methyloligellaceae bacterium]